MSLYYKRTWAAATGGGGGIAMWRKNMLSANTLEKGSALFVTRAASCRRTPHGVQRCVSAASTTDAEASN